MALPDGGDSDKAWEGEGASHSLRWNWFQPFLRDSKNPHPPWKKWPPVLERVGEKFFRDFDPPKGTHWP